MKRALTLIVVVMLAGGSALSAHEKTFKGTVTGLEPGKMTKLHVAVLDEKTKATTAMTFDIDDQTKILRGDVVVKLAEARIQKGEAVSVTVNLDDSETMADIVRLPAKK